MEIIDRILQKLGSHEDFPGVTAENINGYNRLVVPREKLLDICKSLKTKYAFDMLIDIVGVDRFTKINRFEVIYNLWSNESKCRLFLRIALDSMKPEIESVTPIWSTANWQEREVFDMFGIVFLNHPDLRRIYMMDSYEYFPLRKDFPLTGLPGSVELPKK